VTKARPSLHQTILASMSSSQRRHTSERLGRQIKIVVRVARLAGVTDDRLEDFYHDIVFSIWTFELMERGNIPPPPNGRRGRGRRQGSVNWPLQKLVEILWEVAKSHGGNLYADHKRDDGGTMIQALELLRPIILESRLQPETWPPEAGPRPIWPPTNWPVSTIETIIKNFRASGRTWFKITPK